MTPRTSGRATRAVQLLLRITDDESDVLDAAAHLERQTPNAYTYALLQAHVAVLRANPFVLCALENRRQYTEQSAGVLRLGAPMQVPLLGAPELEIQPKGASAPSPG